MPLRVTCPSCSTSLKAPDSAVGKTLKCPKCQAGISVTPAPALPRPARARRVRDDDPPPRRPAEEEYEVIDDEPEPRRPRRKRRKKEEELPGWVKAACWIVAIFMVFVVPAARVLRFHMAVDAIEERAIEREAQKKEAAKVFEARAAPPETVKPYKTTEWTRFDGPDGLFTAYFPPGCSSPEPELRDLTANDPHHQMWCQSSDGHLYSIHLSSYLLKDSIQGDPDYVAKHKNRLGSSQQSTLSGHKARQEVLPSRSLSTGESKTSLVFSVGLGGGRAVGFSILGANGLSFEDPMAKEFFDRIVIHAAAPDADTR